MTEITQDQTRAKFLAGELRALIGQLRRRLRDATDAGELSWTQIVTLSRIETAGKATVTTLAREEGMRPQSMGAIITTLEQVGFVQGAPDPNDGRQTILSLTPRGQDWININRASRLDWLTRAVETRLTEAQQVQLGEALSLLKKLTEP
jgi:DNA-binding MarR family transcriptional regulator